MLLLSANSKKSNQASVAGHIDAQLRSGLLQQNKIFQEQCWPIETLYSGRIAK